MLERAYGPPAPAPAPTPAAAPSAAPGPGVGMLLRLQSSVGNQAVLAMLDQQRSTPLPSVLRASIEAASGVALGDTRVHVDSPAPAAIGAEAFARGDDIHLGPGQHRHLAHEAWHVVQQKQGRVSASGAVAGLAVNRDPALEREADAGTAPAGSDRPPIAATPVVQGQFLPHSRNGEALFVRDEMTNRIYRVEPAAAGSVRLIPVNRRPGDPDSWFVPRGSIEGDPTTAPEGPVPTDAPAPDDGPEDMALGTDDELPLPAGPAPPPPGEEFADREGKGKASGSEAGPYEEQAEEGLPEGVRPQRLVSAFLTQVDVAPATSGSLMFTGRRVYPPEAVCVVRVLAADKRPDTYLPRVKSKNRDGWIENPQGKHTVAFALVRRGLAAMAGLSARDLVIRMSHHLEAVAGFLTTKEGQLIARRYGPEKDPVKQFQEIRATFLSASLSIEVWQTVLSELTKAYVDVSHMSAMATIAGSSTTNGEKTAGEYLVEADELIAGSKEDLLDVPKARRSALAMLDLTQSMPARDYAAGVQHWIDLLEDVCPLLMHHLGDELVEPIVGKKLEKRYREELGLSEKPKRAPVGRGKKAVKAPVPVEVGADVSALLAHFGHRGLSGELSARMTMTSSGSGDGPAVAAVPAPPAALLPLASFPGLERPKFVASVSVDPAAPGVEGNVPGPAGVVVAGLLAADEVIVRRVLTADARPDTAFGSKQRSHTVAWTLLRAELDRFAGRRLDELGLFLEQELAELDGDVEGSLSTLPGHARRQLALVAGAPRPIHLWQSDMSLAVLWYVHAHQMATSTTYADPRTHGRAEGHGEGPHMATLRAAETALADKEAPKDSVERIVDAAVSLLDVSASEPVASVNRAYLRWQRALKRTFPSVVDRHGTAILDRAVASNIATKERPVELGAFLAGTAGAVPAGTGPAGPVPAPPPSSSSSSSSSSSPRQRRARGARLRR